MSDELNRLSAAVVALTAAVDAAVSAIGKPSVDPAALSALVDSVNTQTARLTAAIPPA